jgi:hypothetical protein
MKCFVCGKKIHESKDGIYEISYSKLKDGPEDGRGRTLFYCVECFKDVAGESLIDTLMKNGEKWDW